MILTAPLGRGLGCPRVRGITGGFTLKEKSPDPGIAEGSHARQQPFRSVTPVLFIRMLCLPKAVTSELHAYFHIHVLFTHSKFHPFTVHSWVSLSVCIRPCNHHHNPDENHPFTLGIPVPLCLRSLSPTNLKRPLGRSVTVLPFLEFHKNALTDSLLHLTFFFSLSHSVFEIHLCSSMYGSLVPFYC